MPQSDQHRISGSWRWTITLAIAGTVLLVMYGLASTHKGFEHTELGPPITSLLPES